MQHNYALSLKADIDILNVIYFHLLTWRLFQGFAIELQTPSKSLQGLDIHGASSLNLVYKFLLLETWNEGPVRVWLDSVLSTSWTHLVVESTQTSWRLHRYIVNNQIISYINDNVNNALTVFVNVFTIQLFVCCT